VGVSTDEDVYIELSLYGRKGFEISPRDDLVPVDQAYLEVPYLNNFRLR
jgi:hypothetical protein